MLIKICAVYLIISDHHFDFYIDFCVNMMFADFDLKSRVFRGKFNSGVNVHVGL